MAHALVTSEMIVNTANEAVDPFFMTTLLVERILLPGYLSGGLSHYPHAHVSTGW
jgi:hypothetical protein